MDNPTKYSQCYPIFSVFTTDMSESDSGMTTVHRDDVMDLETFVLKLIQRLSQYVVQSRQGLLTKAKSDPNATRQVWFSVAVKVSAAAVFQTGSVLIDDFVFAGTERNHNRVLPRFECSESEPAAALLSTGLRSSRQHGK